MECCIEFERTQARVRENSKDLFRVANWLPSLITFIQDTIKNVLRIKLCYELLLDFQNSFQTSQMFLDSLIYSFRTSCKHSKKLTRNMKIDPEDFNSIFL